MTPVPIQPMRYADKSGMTLSLAPKHGHGVRPARLQVVQYRQVVRRGQCTSRRRLAAHFASGDYFASGTLYTSVGASDGGSFALQAFERHGPAVRRYFRRLVDEPSAADDLAQEVFLRVVRGAESYRPRERERAWIFRIARNVFLDHQRRAARSVEDARDADALLAPAQDVRLDIRRALEGLPQDERDAFLLGEVGGLTYAEIAALTAATVPAVRSRIYRARLTLRERVVGPARRQQGARITRDFDE